MMSCYNYSEEQSSLNQSPDNLALTESRPKTRSFDCYKKQVLSMKQVCLLDVFKNAYKIVCTSTIVASPYTMSPTPPTSSAMKTPENTE
jgi:hypothetical protein